MSEGKTVPSVLIVDDTWLHVETLKDFFARHGFDVVGEAQNGRESVKLYDRLKPDLVTMDVNMPYMDGIEAVRQIIKRHPDALIIMVSGMGNPTTINQALDSGAFGFVTKPFSDGDLLSRISTVLKSKYPDFFLYI